MGEMLLTKGVISFSASVLGKLVANQLDKDTIDKLFYSYVIKVSKVMQEKYPIVLGGSIELIFSDEEILLNLANMLKKNTDIDINYLYSKLDKDTLPKEFVEEFIILLKEELLKDYLFNNILSEKETHEKIASIESYLRKETEFDFNNFYKVYKHNAINIISQVNYFGLSLSSEIKKARKELADIYVTPKFRMIEKETDTNIILEADLEDENIEEYLNEYDLGFDELQSKIKYSKKHLVVLGKPGSGKSLLIKYLMYHYLKEEDDTSIKYLPFKIELRKYIQSKKLRNINVTSYLVDILNSEYGVNISAKNMKDILAEKNVLLLFDGLDEIFDINEKNSVKNDIENFLSNNKRCKGIITSRVHGYEDVKFSKNEYIELEIKDFDDMQIKTYVEKWYRENEKEEFILEKEVSAFIELKKELEVELVSNPLLLSLIVILYRNNGKLPSSKLDIYKSCTDTLVEKWDENKNLSFEIAVKNKKITIFTYLAYWQYTKLSNKQKEGFQLTNDSVKKKVCEIIVKLKVTDDLNEAEKFADEFLDYAEKRSVYFDNNFTHKTFHEYYTALWIYQNYEVKGKFSDRNEIISKYIENPYWHIVLELLICMIDKNQADEELIDELINEQLEKNVSVQKCNFLTHIISKVDNVSAGVVKKLIKKSIQHCIESIDSNDLKATNDVCKQIFNSLNRLVKIEKFEEIIIDILEELFESYYGYEQEIIKYIIFTIELYPEKVNEGTYYNKYKEWIPKNRYIFHHLLRDAEDSKNNLKDYISLFGKEKLFKWCPYIFKDNVISVPYVVNYLYSFRLTTDVVILKNNLNFLKSIDLDISTVAQLAQTILNITSFNSSKEFKEVIHSYLPDEEESVN